MKKRELPSSAEMSTSARLGEIAAIVAAAIVRTRLALAPRKWADHVFLSARAGSETDGV